MTCLGVLNTDDRDKDNATSLKGKGSIEMSTTFHVYDDALRFDFCLFYNTYYAKVVYVLVA